MATDYLAAKKAQLAPIGTSTLNTTVQKAPVGSSLIKAVAEKPVSSVPLAPVSSNSTSVPSNTTAKPVPTAPLANAVTSKSTPATGFGGATYGSSAAANSAIAANQKALSDPNYVKSEIDRTLGVIQQRQSQGLDTSAQQKYLTANLGYSGAPVVNQSGVPEWVTAQAETDLANQIAALQGMSNTYQKQLASSLDQNNQYVAKQIDGAQQLQNRRGGLYSGGYDYQAGAITTAGLQRQADLQAQYGDQINSIAQQIANLQQAQPNIIQAKINDYLNNQTQRDATISGLTGIYNGQQTLAAQNQSFNQASQTKKDNWNAYMDIVNATNNLGAGPSTDWSRNVNNAYAGEQTDAGVTNAQSRDIASRNYAINEWTTAGYATPVVAAILGVPEGTPTNDASYRAASQQLDSDKFTYSQMQDVAEANQTKTINSSTAGDLLSSALRKQIGVNDNGQPIYGTYTDPNTREQAFVDLYNNYGVSGNDMIAALTKAGYTLKEINALKQEHPTVFQ